MNKEIRLKKFDELSDFRFIDQNNRSQIRFLVEKLLDEQLQDIEKWAKDTRTLEIDKMENSPLVVDRMYHKGKVHLIDDILSFITDKE